MCEQIDILCAINEEEGLKQFEEVTRNTVIVMIMILEQEYQTH